MGAQDLGHLDVFRVVSTDDEKMHFGAPSAESGDQLDAVHLGHDHVQENRVGFVAFVSHLKEAGARDQEIIETIGQMSMFAGLPAMTRAMQLAQEVMEDKEDTEK